VSDRGTERIGSFAGAPCSLVAITVALVAVLAFVVWGLADPLPVVADDTLFYPEIARHLTEGDGSTFSGLMPTNGYHPLWMVLLTPVVWMVPADWGPESQLRVLIAYWLAAFALGLVLVLRLLRATFDLPDALVAGCVLPICLGFAMFNLWGSEAAVNLVGITIAVGAARRHCLTPTVRNAALLGAALAVAVFARLDNVTLVAAVLSLTLVGSARMSRRQWVVSCSTVAVLVAPYLVWNLATVGHIETISAAIKSDLGSPGFRLGALPAFGWATAVCLAFAGLAWWWSTKRGPPVARPQGLLVHTLLLASGLHLLTYLLFAVGSLAHWAWYFVLELVSLSAVLAALADRWMKQPHPGRTVWAPVLASFAVLAITAGAVTQAVGSRADHAPAAARLHDFAGELPRDGVVMALDLPGVVAFGSTTPVVAFDGLTGDFDYQADLERRGVLCTMADLDVEIVVSPPYLSWSRPIDVPGYGQATVELAGFLHRQPVGAVTVSEADELLRSPGGELVAWRVEPMCAGR